MAIRTEVYGGALFVYSVEQQQADDDATAIGIASLREVPLSDGAMFVEGKFEIRPSCPPNEISEVRTLLLEHISRRSCAK